MEILATRHSGYQANHYSFRYVIFHKKKNGWRMNLAEYRLTIWNMCINFHIHPPPAAKFSQGTDWTRRYYGYPLEPLNHDGGGWWYANMRRVKRTRYSKWTFDVFDVFSSLALPFHYALSNRIYRAWSFKPCHHLTKLTNCQFRQRSMSFTNC